MSVVLVGLLSVASATIVPSTRLYNGTDLLRARDAVRTGSDPDLVVAHKTLVRFAKSALDAPAESVTNKTLSLPGVSSRNYVSIGVYNHPCNALPVGCKPYPGQKPFDPADCDNSTGLPWTPCDGIRNSDAINEGDSPAQSRMVNTVSTLALAAFYEHDVDVVKAYVAKAASMIRTWFLDTSTGMLPNLYYGQIKPRKSAPAKGHGGFIEWTNTASLLDHVSLMRFADPKGEAWTQEDDRALQQWFAEFLEYVEGGEAGGERRMANNHGTYFDALWQAVALYAPAKDALVEECSSCSECGWNGTDAEGQASLGGGGHSAQECQQACLQSSHCNYAALSTKGYCHLFSSCKAGTLQGDWMRWAGSAAAAAHEVNFNRVATQVLPNGTEWIEVQRNDGVHYAIYNLQAFANNGDLATAGGSVDVWQFATDDGRSIRGAVDWMLQYALGELPWPYGTTPDSYYSLHEPLRQAAHAFQHPDYEMAACKVYAGAKKTDYATNVFNLRLPPRYKVPCTTAVFV